MPNRGPVLTLVAFAVVFASGRIPAGQVPAECSGGAEIPEDTTLVAPLPCGETGRLHDLGVGNLRTVAGNLSPGFAGDGGLATEAGLNFPAGVTVDGAGNVYIADWGNHVVRRVDAASGVITTVAGTGVPGFAGDGGPATQALLNQPIRLALDRAGNLFISDSGNGRVRRVDGATGIISTVIGGGAWAIDSNVPATEVGLNFPTGIAFDRSGSLFIAEVGHHRVRRVTAGADGLITGAQDELITTAVSTGVEGFAGDGSAAKDARFLFPEDVAFDGAGNLFIVDRGNNRVAR